MNRLRWAGWVLKGLWLRRTFVYLPTRRWQFAWVVARNDATGALTVDRALYDSERCGMLVVERAP